MSQEEATQEVVTDSELESDLPEEKNESEKTDSDFSLSAEEEEETAEQENADISSDRHSEAEIIPPKDSAKPLGENFSDDDILFIVTEEDEESANIVLEENILKEKKETKAIIAPEEITETSTAEITVNDLAVEPEESTTFKAGSIEITEEPEQESEEVLVLDSKIDIPEKPDYLEKIEGIKITGVTGKSGAGKSIIARKLAKKNKNSAIIDADKLYHNLLGRENLAVGIVFALGNEVLTDKKIDRKKLAGIVFSDKEKLQKLNEATHPFIAREIRRLIEGAKNKGIKEVVLDAPTLFESGIDALCDEIIFVKADKEVRLERIEKRDKISHEDALNRLKYEKDDKFYTEKCSAIITNN